MLGIFGIERRPASMALDRLNALSDGVFAIVLTLLVLGIEVPENHPFSEDGLLAFLYSVEYQIVVYAVSFVLGGTYAVIQHVMFHHFSRGTRTLMWLNLVLLFLMTLLPFTTKLIGTYRHEPLVMLVYGVVNVACFLSLILIWWYANRTPGMLRPGIQPDVSRMLTRRLWAGIGFCLIAISVAFVNVRLSHVVFLTIPLLYLKQDRVDRELANIETRPENSGS